MSTPTSICQETMDSRRICTPTVESHAYDSALRLGDSYFSKMIAGKNFGRLGIKKLRGEAAQIDQHMSSIEVYHLKHRNLRNMPELSGLSDEGIGVLEAILTNR